MSKVFIERLSTKVLSANDVLRAMEWLGWQKLVPKDSRVFIKPNLTWPNPLPGVTTTPEAIEALVVVLKERTSNITIGESDGGYHSYYAEEAFKGHKLYDIGEKYRVRVVNLSKDERETIIETIAGNKVSVTLPHILLHETDVFITMPVPKTHVMTGVSLAFTPTVLDNGRISLVVAPEVSAIDPIADTVNIQGFDVPSLVTRRASTTIELGDGQSFVIAGLLENNYSNAISQFPWLGDLPAH